ncbi:hypothetical protein [Eisenbergiella sp.]
MESYARLNTRPSTYGGYKRTIKNYIVPYGGHEHAPTDRGLLYGR